MDEDDARLLNAMLSFEGGLGRAFEAKDGTILLCLPKLEAVEDKGGTYEKALARLGWLHEATKGLSI